MSGTGPHPDQWCETKPIRAHPVFAYLRGENSPRPEGTAPNSRPSSLARMHRHQTLGPPKPGRPRRRGGSGGGRWSVPSGGTAVSFRRSWARVRYLVFGNHERAEHKRRENPFDERGADRRALLPPMGRLQKGSAHEPQLRHRRGRANLGSDAGERQETRPSPLNRLWRASEGDGDATAKRRKTRYRKSRWK
jgi:hypothetical protein